VFVISLYFFQFFNVFFSIRLVGTLPIALADKKYNVKLGNIQGNFEQRRHLMPAVKAKGEVGKSK
jgi:hypothetical protein